MKPLGKRLCVALLTGYIFFYYGECLFWGTPDREGMGLAELLITWLVYSLLAYVFLCVVSLFNVRNVWAVSLVVLLSGHVGIGRNEMIMDPSTRSRGSSK